MPEAVSMKSLSCWREQRNKYSGSVFILASGPSANDFPIKKYADYPFIAVNGSVSKLIESNVKPLFYIGTDLGALKHLGNLVIEGVNFSKNVAFSQNIFDDILLKNKDLIDKKLGRVYFLEKCNRIDKYRNNSDRMFAFKKLLDNDLSYNFNLFSQRKNRIGFSYNLEKGYYCARTIVYTAVQLAKYLGFNKVFIVGMDLSNEARFYEKDGQPYDTDALTNNYERFIMPSFKYLGRNIVDDDFAVYNLSVRSQLPNAIISKVEIDKVDGYL